MFFKKIQKFRKSALHVIHFWKIKISLILHIGEMSGLLSQKVEISWKSPIGDEDECFDLPPLTRVLNRRNFSFFFENLAAKTESRT